MAKGDTKTNQYLDIAANGTRADLPTDTCCETRSQTLIREVAERIMDVEDEVEELKNNPDVVDIVATYADLQAYDTQHLTDKDIIRVLQDETHDGDSTYYRYNKQTDTWTYIGESKQYMDFVGTDGTTAGTAGLVPAPATTDAGKFLKADGTWDSAGGNSSPAIELTSADYNYHSSGDADDGVAVWLLDRGYYCLTGPAKIYWTSTAPETISVKVLFVVSHTNYNGRTGNHKILLLGTYAKLGDQEFGPIYNYAVESNGTSTTYNLANKNGYLLTGKSIVNVTGSSSDAVMSQNATTSMVFADPSVREAVRIGNTKTVYSGGVGIGRITGSGATGASGGNSIAIGSDVSADTRGAVSIGNEASIRGIAKGAIALGAYSKATSAGEMNIGSTDTSYGYNSSKYRLLTGLYDPQSAHDAATKGYVDPTTDSSAPTSATVGRLGQIRIDTTTATAYMCVEADDVTPSYTWKQITA